LRGVDGPDYRRTAEIPSGLFARRVYILENPAERLPGEAFQVLRESQAPVHQAAVALCSVKVFAISRGLEVDSAIQGVDHGKSGYGNSDLLHEPRSNSSFAIA
jgi:hypothetical protein